MKLFLIFYFSIGFFNFLPFQNRRRFLLNLLIQLCRHPFSRLHWDQYSSLITWQISAGTLSFRLFLQSANGLLFFLPLFCKKFYTPVPNAVSFLYSDSHLGEVTFLVNKNVKHLIKKRQAISDRVIHVMVRLNNKYSIQVKRRRR